MVRHHPSGEKAEIDYCDGIDILDLATGEITRTYLFVGVLCRSRYTYAEFSFSQKSADFLNSYVRMFNFFGGVPRQIAPDNLKSAVAKTHKYDPDINPSYQRLAQHFKIAVVSARVRSPKDKAIVERSIQIFQRWFFKKVRKRTFTSLIELNKALHEHLIDFNGKKHRILRCSRAEAFAEEKKDLGSLPECEFTVRTHKRCTLHHDCHLQFETNFYSASWELRGKELDVWASEKTIEIFHGGKLVAQHSRSRTQSKFTTTKDHYPPAHKTYLEITPQYLLEKSQGSGENVYKLINSLFSEAYPLQHLRRAQGIVALINKYPKEQLDHACEQALILGKTFVATAIGHQACVEGHTVLFEGMNCLIETIKLNRMAGTFLRLRKKLIEVDLLIIDDLGIKPLDGEMVQDLYDLLEERYLKKSTIITSQLPVTNWREVITDAVVFEAIVDRVAHGYKIEITGESYRKRRGVDKVKGTSGN